MGKYFLKTILLVPPQVINIYRWPAKRPPAQSWFLNIGLEVQPNLGNLEISPSLLAILLYPHTHQGIFTWVVSLYMSMAPAWIKCVLAESGFELTPIVLPTGPTRVYYMFKPCTDIVPYIFSTPHTYIVFFVFLFKL